MWKNSSLRLAFWFVMTLSLLCTDRWTLQMLCDADVQQLYHIPSNCSLSSTRRVYSRPCRHLNQRQRSSGRSSTAGPRDGLHSARKLLRMPKRLCLVDGTDQGCRWKCWTVCALVKEAPKDKRRNLSMSRECADTVEKTCKQKKRGRKTRVKKHSEP